MKNKLIILGIVLMFIAAAPNAGIPRVSAQRYLVPQEICARWWTCCAPTAAWI
jgi:hypothetical protein